MSSLRRMSLWDNSIGLVSMVRVNAILGNLSSPEWAHRAESSELCYIELDGWMAQRSRFVAKSTDGEEFAISLGRNVRLRDGDVVAYDGEAGRMTVVRLKLSDLLVIDLGTLARQGVDVAMRSSVELGHALGNQHWAAVVRGTKVYVPMVVDRKVMESVMKSHHFEHIFYSFRPANQIIPYLSPYEVRRLLGTHPEAEHHHL